MVKTFIQHLLENEPASPPTTMSDEEKQQLMELLSKAYVVSQQNPEMNSGEFDMHTLAQSIADIIEQLPGESENSHVYNNSKPEYEFNSNDVNPDEFGGEEEIEAKLPAKRDRQMAINKWIQDVNKPTPLSRIKSQENRLNRRLYGGKK